MARKRKDETMIMIQPLVATPETPVIPVEEPTIFLEHKAKLRVMEPQVFGIHPLTSAIEIENLGGGDVYVVDKSLNFVAENRIAPFSKRTVEPTDSVTLCAASRPTVSVRQYK